MPHQQHHQLLAREPQGGSYFSTLLLLLHVEGDARVVMLTRVTDDERMTEQSMEDQITKYSANLNRDAVYSKQTRIAKLPPYLCVQLIRFWWNDRAKVRAKISRVRPTTTTTTQTAHVATPGSLVHSLEMTAGRFPDAPGHV